LGFAPLLAPELEQSGFIAAHDDAGVRAAKEGSAAPRVCPQVRFHASTLKSRGLTSAQIRAARALVRWTAEDLSRQSAVSLRTIRRAELAERDTSMTA